MESLAYLARQPILDREGKIFAYELLFRDSPSSDTAVIASDLQATAQVLENVINNIGLGRLIGKHKAFINCSREMLLDNLFELLSPQNFVLEILEDVTVDEQLIEAVEHYRRCGFEIALDDFIFEEKFVENFKPLFRYTSYVKMDLADNTAENVEKAIHFFKPLGIQLLAEKVEDAATFKRCSEIGYDYFQGFFFAKPELVTGRKIDANSAAILQIILQIRSQLSLDELCMRLDAHPSIKENLLKFVNSDIHPRHSNIGNIKDAIVWVGMRRIQEWLMLMLYARPEMGISFQEQQPLSQNASHRARFLEIVADTIDISDAEFSAKAFTVGLISRMDALICAPFENILECSTVDNEVREAILYRRGRLGALLQLADAVEMDNRLDIQFAEKQLGLTDRQLNFCINEAYSWTNER